MTFTLKEVVFPVVISTDEFEREAAQPSLAELLHDRQRRALDREQEWVTVLHGRRVRDVRTGKTYEVIERDGRRGYWR